MRARDEYENFVARHPELPTLWIDVIADRPLSQWVAQETGVRHESPQALLFDAGRVVWHGSHGSITAAALEAAVVR